MKINRINELNVAIVGIKVSIIAIILTLCVEVINQSTLFSDLNPNLVSLLYLGMAIFLFVLVIKIKIPKKNE